MKAFSIFGESTYFCESRKEAIEYVIYDYDLEEADEDSVEELDIYETLKDMIDTYEMDYHAVIKGGVLL